MIALKSIRWRLPLSYGLIALLAAFALGAVLLTTLRGYYAQREYEHMRNNAFAISRTVSGMRYYELSDDEIQTQLESLAFLSQSRIRILDLDKNMLIDSGDVKEPRMIALNYSAADAQTDFLYQPIVENSDSPSVGVASDGGAAATATFYGTIDVFPPFAAPARPILDSAGIERRFFMAVGGTPWGFNLNSDAPQERHSDQIVQMPLYNEINTLTGYVELSDGPAHGTEITDGVARALITAGLVAVALAAIVGWFISRQINMPLNALTAATSHMAEGDLTVRVSMQRLDELGLLANAFNHMASRVENTVTTLRRFVADAAHELHTPITALHANLELAATESDVIQMRIFIERAQEQLRRLEVMTSGLLDLSRLEAGANRDERMLVDLVALVSEVSELYASRAEQVGLVFQTDTPSVKVVATVSEAQIRRVVGNLLDNAIKFTPENGIIRIGLRQDGTTIRIWVQDTGIGIPSDELPHLFSRFRRARNAAAYPGSGLGLAIIKAIVEGHGGNVMVESSSQGTRFMLNIPSVA